MHRTISSDSVICLMYLLTLLTNISVEANCVDQDQTAPIRTIWLESNASKTFQQLKKADDVCCDWYLKG